jgi:transposase
MPYVTHDFKCPYVKSCPHLDWLSAHWVLEEYRRGQDDYHEHIEIIDRFYAALKEKDERMRILEKENAELNAKLKLLHQRQFKPNQKEETADKKKGSLEDLSLKKKKRGAPTGHPGWARSKPDRIDRTVHVPAPTRCPYCMKDNLEPHSGLHEHIQEDIVIEPRAEVVRYLHEQRFCSTCNRPVVQSAEGEILNAPIGPVAKSVAIFLRYRIGVSYRKTTEIFRELFGLNFVPASAVGFDRKAALLGSPIHEDLREKIRAADRVHADETSWRNDGIGHYVWFAGNNELAYFHIDRHRSADVAKAIFGDNFPGILVRDRYAAYNGIGTEWQSCLAHIRTKAKEIKKEHRLLPQTDQEASTDRFCDRVKDFCSKACDIGAKLISGDLSRQSAPEIEKELVKLLSNICKKPLSFKSAETLRSYLAGPEQKFLFTFLRYPGVPPTNNHAEQSIRHMVIFRKTSFGTRSESGLKTHSILPSLVQTARRQGIPPIRFLKSLFTADTSTTQAALYKNSS